MSTVSLHQLTLSYNGSHHLNIKRRFRLNVDLVMSYEDAIPDVDLIDVEEEEDFSDDEKLRTIQKMVKIFMRKMYLI